MTLLIAVLGLAATLACHAASGRVERHSRPWWTAKLGVFLAGSVWVFAATSVAGVVLFAPLRF